MRTARIALLAAALGLASWAGPAAAGLLSATGPVIGLLGDEVFEGVGEVQLDGSGTLLIQSQKNAALSCRGQFMSSPGVGGAGQMQCSDGANAAFSFQSIGLRTGHGSAGFARGPMHLTYGLTAEQSAPYLALPPGRTLERNGKNLQLAGRAPPPAAAPPVAAKSPEAPKPGAAPPLAAAGAADEVLPDAQARYQADRTTCKDRASRELREACLREADERLFALNRLLRCSPLPPEDRGACLRRVRAEGPKIL